MKILLKYLLVIFLFFLYSSKALSQAGEEFLEAESSEEAIQAWRILVSDQPPETVMEILAAVPPDDPLEVRESLKVLCEVLSAPISLSESTDESDVAELANFATSSLMQNWPAEIQTHGLMIGWVRIVARELTQQPWPFGAEDCASWGHGLADSNLVANAYLLARVKRGEATRWPYADTEFDAYFEDLFMPHAEHWETPSEEIPWGRRAIYYHVWRSFLGNFDRPRLPDGSPRRPRVVASAIAEVLGESYRPAGQGEIFAVGWVIISPEPIREWFEAGTPDRPSLFDGGAREIYEIVPASDGNSIENLDPSSRQLVRETGVFGVLYIPGSIEDHLQACVAQSRIDAISYLVISEHLQRVRDSHCRLWIITPEGDAVAVRPEYVEQALEFASRYLAGD